MCKSFQFIPLRVGQRLSPYHIGPSAGDISFQPVGYPADLFTFVCRTSMKGEE